MTTNPTQDRIAFILGTTIIEREAMAIQIEQFKAEIERLNALVKPDKQEKK